MIIAKKIAELDNLVLSICKENKSFLSSLKSFESTFKKLYEINNFSLKLYHIKYIFEKYKKLYFPKLLDEIYEYSKYIEELGYFCRSINKSMILDSKKNYRA